MLGNDRLEGGWMTSSYEEECLSAWARMMTMMVCISEHLASVWQPHRGYGQIQQTRELFGMATVKLRDELEDRGAATELTLALMITRSLSDTFTSGKIFLPHLHGCMASSST